MALRRTAKIVACLFVLSCGTRSTSESSKDAGKEIVQTHDGDVTTASDERLKEADATQPGKRTIAQVQSSDISKVCQNPNGFTNGDKGIEMADVVVASKRFVASKNQDGTPKLYGYYVADLGLSEFQPFSGILMVIDPSLDQNFQEGDVISMIADHTEFYCMSELKATSVTKVRSQEPVPLPLLVSDKTIFENGGTEALTEPYEGVLVTISDVTITETTSSDGKGWFRVGNGIEVMRDFEYSYTPKKGVVIAKLTGFVKFHYGKYRIVPRSDEDIVEKTEAEPSPEVVEPSPDAFETEVQAQGFSIYEIQSGSPSTSCPQEGNTVIQQGVTLKPVVVVSPKFSVSQTLDGYYVQDPQSTWANQADPKFTGMLLVIGKDKNTMFSPGDLLSVVGDYKEYYCFTEIVATSATKIGTETVPEPVVVSSQVFENGGTPDCEPYEGVKVTLENLLVTDVIGGTQPTWWFKLGNGILVANDFRIQGFTPAIGMQIQSISGAVKQSWGKYLIVPFTAQDIVLAPLPPDISEEVQKDAVTDEGSADASTEDVAPQKVTVFSIQSGYESTGCTPPGSNLTIQTGVSLEDVVVVTPKHSAASSLDGYYVRDLPQNLPLGNQGQYAGILVVVRKTMNTNFVPGDVVSIVGDYKEYYCMSEISATSITKVSEFTPLPDDIEVDKTIFAQGGTSDAEPYEGVRVILRDVTITDTSGGRNPLWWFKVDDGIYVANDYQLQSSFTPQQGTHLSELRGAVKYSYGKYLIVPVSAQDIVLAPQR